jgi:DUF1365 family protein
MLGYVFNPVAFWVCHDVQGAVRAVLAEVNNTFGETLVAAKRFHVSPFCPVRGHYAFRFRFGDDRWLARIDYFDDADQAVPLLETSVSGMIEPLPASAARLFLRYRWFTAGVVARIHFQAARLWLRRVPFFTKPAPPRTDVSRSQ